MPWASKVHQPIRAEVRAAIRRAKGREEYRHDPYAGMYNMPEWRDPRIGIRAERLRREPLCRECGCEGRRTRAAEVDHVIPHKGDMNLFLSLENTQSLCKSHHSSKTAREQ